jgi:hypothetical protein
MDTEVALHANKKQKISHPNDGISKQNFNFSIPLTKFPSIDFTFPMEGRYDILATSLSLECCRHCKTGRYYDCRLYKKCAELYPNIMGLIDDRKIIKQANSDFDNDEMSNFPIQNIQTQNELNELVSVNRQIIKSGK